MHPIVWESTIPRKLLGDAILLYSLKCCLIYFISSIALSIPSRSVLHMADTATTNWNLPSGSLKRWVPWEVTSISFFCWNSTRLITFGAFRIFSKKAYRMISPICDEVNSSGLQSLILDCSTFLNTLIALTPNADPSFSKPLYFILSNT